MSIYDIVIRCTTGTPPVEFSLIRLTPGSRLLLQMLQVRTIAFRFVDDNMAQRRLDDMLVLVIAGVLQDATQILFLQKLPLLDELLSLLLIFE